ncbi:hypothetical protein TSOC_003666, partial [Tetrabaena socialis]
VGAGNGARPLGSAAGSDPLFSEIQPLLIPSASRAGAGGSMGPGGGGAAADAPASPRGAAAATMGPGGGALGIDPKDIIVRAVYKGGQKATRRLLLAKAERVWTARELSSMLPSDTNMRLLVHVRSFTPGTTTLSTLRQRELALHEVLPGTGAGSSRRRLQQEEEAPAVLVDFTVVRYIEVPLPPSPPPSPPLSPGMQAPPTAPPTPLSPPPRPPRLPLNLDLLASELGAEKVFNAPSPSPSPPSPPPPRARNATVNVTGIFGQGSVGNATKPVVWYDDADFRAYRVPRSPLNLVFWGKNVPCKVTPGVCSACPRAWTAPNASRSTPICFREPMQLDAIAIMQRQNPGVVSVQLLPGPATAIPGLRALQPRNVTLGEPVWSAANDTTACGSELVIRLPSARSGTREAVPVRGSQGALPPRLRRTAVGGIIITVKEQQLGALPTVIEGVRFSGRVLYPRNPALYAPA